MEEPTYNFDPGQQPAPQPQESGKSIACLVLGIVSIVFSFIVAIVGLVTGIVGVVLGVQERNYSSKAKAGFVCSIIGIVISALALIAMMILRSLVAAALPSILGALM